MIHNPDYGVKRPGINVVFVPTLYAHSGTEWHKEVVMAIMRIRTWIPHPFHHDAHPFCLLGITNSR